MNVPVYIEAFIEWNDDGEVLRETMTPFQRKMNPLYVIAADVDDKNCSGFDIAHDFKDLDVPRGKEAVLRLSVKLG